MARGFGAGENRISLRTPGRGEELELPGGIAGRDGRSAAQVARDAAAVEKAFNDALANIKNIKGFGAAEEAIKASWMPAKADLPSSKGNYKTSLEAAEADTKAIINSMPPEIRTEFVKAREDERQRQEKNIGSQNVNGVNAAVMKRLESKYPEAFAALKDVAARQAVAKSADLKKEIEARRRANDTFDEAYENAWNAAREAFNSADEVAKMVLKKGDESYGDAREYVSVNGLRTGEKEVVTQLRPGEPSISGRVLAVNSGILMARRAAEAALSKLEKVNEKHNKKSELKVEPVSDAIKNDVLRLVTEKMISDKGAFLQVRGYIPPTSTYVGPVNKDRNPVQHINIFGDYGY